MGVAEHSDGVFFAESGTHRIGPFAFEAAHREAARLNEYEVVIALAEAMLEAKGELGLAGLVVEPRFAGAVDPRLGAAIAVLHEHGEYDACAETGYGPVVLVDRFLAVLERGGVVVHEYDSPSQAEANFEVLREEG
ncbi:MAG: hypothetical protein JST59_29625 [Actinobacteria bacterium]|nr:hypothetical protein [Actinomycetota bacterium]